MTDAHIAREAVAMGPAIPVLRMLDESSTRAFYIDYLDFQIDWEHRFREGSPLYAQIRLGDAVIHLDGHKGESHAPCEVRIPVQDLEALHAILAAHSPDDPPVLVDPRGAGHPTDMNLVDPSGNLLTFWRTPAP